MAVLVLGAYGHIGQAVVARLRSEGRAVVGLGRSVAEARRRWPDVVWREADLEDLTDPAAWAPLLAGVDAVVNAAGALQQGLRDDLETVQAAAIAALAQAAGPAGVSIVVQISAGGARADAETEFLRTKGLGDAALRAAAVPVVILRPGLVISTVAYGGTALLRALAAFPAMTPVAFAESRVRTVAMDDLVEAVAAALDGRIAPGSDVELVEGEGRSLAETVQLFRRWLGLADAPLVKVPSFAARWAAAVADGLGWLGWRSPLRSTSLRVMAQGVDGEPAAGVAALGRKLLSLPETLARLPVGPQERWFARLWLAKPLVLASLSAFWLVSGAMAVVDPNAAAAVLLSRGAPWPLAKLAVALGAGLDIVLGLAVLVRPAAGAALVGMIGATVLYLAGSLVFAPDLWLDPLGPMVKAIPAALLALVALAILPER